MAWSACSKATFFSKPAVSGECRRRSFRRTWLNFLVDLHILQLRCKYAWIGRERFTLVVRDSTHHYLNGRLFLRFGSLAQARSFGAPDSSNAVYCCSFLSSKCSHPRDWSVLEDTPAGRGGVVRSDAARRVRRACIRMAASARVTWRQGVSARNTADAEGPPWTPERAARGPRRSASPPRPAGVPCKKKNPGAGRGSPYSLLWLATSFVAD